MADVHTTQEFEDSHVSLTPVNADGQQQSSSVSSQFVTSMLNPTPDAGIESIFEPTPQIDVQTPTLVAPLPVSAPTLTPLTIATITTTLQAPTPSTTAPSTLLQDLPNFGSLFGFDHRLKTLEAKFSEFMQTNQFAGAVSSILGIVQRYMDQQMNEAVKEITCSCFHGFVDKDLINLVIPNVRRYVVVLTEVRTILDEIFLPSVADATRWVKYIPIKMNVFAWCARLDRFSARSNLVRRGVVLDSSLCPLCGLVPEDIHHILFRCDTAKLVFHRICRWWDLD
nr:RNA-directed DNA polymerase, eukaryota [Tanacetum cinerariifolium]